MSAVAPQLMKSYRGFIRDTSSFTAAEIQVIIDGTVILLRRHSTQGTICSRCGNDDLNLCQVTNVDKFGFITEVQCLECGKSLSTICRKSRYYLEQICDESVLERGDHVVWYRPLAYYHHAIVSRQEADRVAVIAYGMKDRQRPCATVAEREYRHGSMASMTGGSVYRIFHDDCYTNEYTALRAQRTLGEEKYDLFEQNCEHSTTWCKTGRHSSYQLESCFSSILKVALAVFLRAVVLSVFWLLQICNLIEERAAGSDGLGVQRIVTIAYVCLIATSFATHSIYKGCSKIKSHLEPHPCDSPDDGMEACRRDCTNEAFQFCCGGRPGCSRVACSLCFAACLCCSFCEAVCSLCVQKVRVCIIPCCGRPVPAVLGLVFGSFVREAIGASGPFTAVWYSDDIVAYFDDILVSDSEIVNRAFIVIAAVVVSSIVTYPIGVLVSRWVEAVFECTCCRCCQCYHPSDRSDRVKKYPCPVHDEVVHIPAPYSNFNLTSIPVGECRTSSSAVILL